jgi:hypothetical protein
MSLMASKKKGGKKLVSNLDTDVNVSLEKAEETIVPKQSIALVDTSIIQSIKNQAQIREEAIQETERFVQERQKAATRNKLMFYGAIALSVGACYLVHRYFKAAPPTEYVLELANGVADIVTDSEK